MRASAIITDAAAFTTGTLARNAQGQPCGLGPDSGAVQFDCLGALLWAYPDPSARNCVTDAEKRIGVQPIAKRVFDLCRARFGHTRLGHLEHGEAWELLRDAGA